MKTDVNGCSTCWAGEERYEYFDDPSGRKRHLVQYEYRSPISGNLFTCVALSLEIARNRRDEFMHTERDAEHEAEKRFNENHPELNP